MNRMYTLLLSTLMLVGSAFAVTRPPGIFIQADKNIYYKAGETVQMPCEARGNPNPGYYWKRNEVVYNPSGNDARVVQLPNKGTLVISKPEDKDEGIYQCFARNDFGTSVSVRTNLREARLRSFAVTPPEILRVELGRPLELNCVPPESVPPPDVFWVIKGQDGDFEPYNYDARVSMDREYRLRFANVIAADGQDGKAYACMALNTIMRDVKQGPLFYLKTRGREEMLPVSLLWSDQEDMFGLRGSTMNIKCIFGGNPTPSVHWERTNNKSMTTRHQLKSFAQELQIVNLQFEDAGKYQCWAVNSQSAGRFIKGFTIRVQSAPYFVKEPENVEIGVGGNVEFECLADGKPPPEIKWYVNGVPYDDLKDPKFVGRLQRLTETKLYMDNVLNTDQMCIQCNASNLHGYVFADVYLNVLSEAPTIIEPPPVKKLSAEGTPINITCKVAGKPEPVITWFKDGQQITGGRFEILPDGDLHIKGVALADAGHYRCQAHNRFNMTYAEGSLVVRRKTMIEQRPGDLEVIAGNDGKFTCSGTTDPEEAKNLRIVWYKDGEAITTNDDRMTTNIQDNSLTISGTIVRDSGTYTCVATNGLDESRASALLTIKDRPDAPTGVYHDDCNKNLTIKVHWMPGSYNNAPVQYFVVQYNTSFNSDQWHFGVKVNSTENKVNMTLSPWVDYTFRVIAFNKIGPSEPSSHSPKVCSTKEGRPYHQPRNLRTIGFQPNKLYIEWTPMPPLEQNAPGFYYILQARRLGTSQTSGKEPYQINNWEENFKEIDAPGVYTPYEIDIKAVNNVGEAMEDPPVIIGFSAEGRPKDTVIPWDLTTIQVGDTFAIFTWMFRKSEIVEVPTEKEQIEEFQYKPSDIQGEFKGFKVQFWEENNKAFTIREENISPDAGRNLTGDLFRSRIDNMLPNTRMVAHVAVMNNFYIGTPSDAIRFRTEAGLPGPVYYFRPLNIGDTHINLEWGPPEENRGDLEGYDISYRLVSGLDLGEMQEREPQINDPFATQSYLSGLKPSSKYRVYIAARTVAGRGESYFIEVVTAKPGVSRMPKFSIASVGKNNVNVTWWINPYAGSGTVVYVEYRKLDGAEWLRTTDEVVHTWKNVENLEPGTTYEFRLKTTNGQISLPSAIEEITTDGDAEAYDLVSNIGWFLGMLFSILLIIALIVLFVVCYKRGFRFDREKKTTYQAPYSDTVGVSHNDDQFGPEPRGYNNDYYDRRDYHNYEDGNAGFDEKRPPSYSSDPDKRYPTNGEYEPYNADYDKPEKQDYDYGDYYDRRQGDDYREGQDYNYDDRRRDDYYDDRRDDYDRANDNQDRYNDKREYDDRDYGRRDEYYNRRDRDYDDRRYDEDTSSKTPTAPSTFV